MLSKNYFVEDIIPEDIKRLKVLFIFESPYKQELLNGYPVAGGSGKTVSRFLNKIDTSIPDFPFGQYMNFFKDERFGIANCSNYPMDKAAYEDNAKVPYKPEILDLIRKKLTGSGKITKDLEDTYQELRNDFKKRILNYTDDNDVIIVLCGKIAHNFFIDSGIDIDNNVISVPHPSRNQWVYERYKNIMEDLAELINEAIN